MSDPSVYTYESPLKGYENAPALSDELNEDGKSYVSKENSDLSKSYTKFTPPLNNGIRGGL